nr:hypothetical protein [Mycobacterium leprae]
MLWLNDAINIQVRSVDPMDVVTLIVMMLSMDKLDSSVSVTV